MATIIRWLPTLDGSSLLFVKFFSATIARTANVLASSAKGAVSGIAQLDTGVTTLKPAQLVAGDVILVRWNGVWPASRPTARTDVTVWAEAPTSISTADTWTDNAPTWLIDNDRFEVRDLTVEPGFGVDAFGSGPFGF